MKKTLNALAILHCVLLVSAQAAAVEAVWYDPVRQALGFDPYHDGPRGTMEFDFNDDRSWAAISSQGGSHYLYGYTTTLGLYKTNIGPIGGQSTVFGWGERLGTLNPQTDFSTDVTALYYGAVAPDQFHYFTDVWNVAAGQTRIYLQPIVDGQPVPVLEEDLVNTYFRYCDGPSPCIYVSWQSLADLYQAPPIEVQIDVNPKTINLKSAGTWVTVYIEPPTGHLADEIDPSTIHLAVGSSQRGVWDIEKAILEAVDPMEIADESDHGPLDLMIRFDRRALISQLAPGEVQIIVSGQLYSGEDFQGSKNVRTISPGADKCLPAPELN